MDYKSFIAKKQKEYGDKFDASDLAPQFAPYLGTDTRIRVLFTYDQESEVRHGTVGVTTGWRPVFLLMARSTAHGSSTTLGKEDAIIAVRVGEKYVSV